MASADGSVAIAIELQTKDFKTDAENVKEILSSLGSHSGDKLDESFKKGTERVQREAKETGEKVKEDLDKTVEAKYTLHDEASGKAKEASEKIRHLPHEHTTTMSAEDHTGNVLSKIKDRLSGLKKQGENTSHTFRNMFLGSALGNLSSNLFSNAVSGMKKIVSEGMQLNAVTGGIKAQFKAMGFSDSYVDKLVKQIGYLKVRINATGVDISTVQKNMMNWSVLGRDNAMKMTTALAGMAAAGRLNGDQFRMMSMQMMRVGSSGKVSLGTLSRIAKAVPNFYATLAKGAGVSEDKLKSMLATGKVTQKQFQGWLANSSKYADEAFKGYGKTQAGALIQMKGAWQSLESKMTQPLFDMKTSALQQLASLMASGPVQDGAALLGKGLQRIAFYGMDILKYLGQHKSDITGVAKDVVKIASTLAEDVWKDISGILVDIGKQFGLVNKSSKHSGDALHQFKELMDGIAKNKDFISTIANIAAGFIAFKGISKLLSPLKTITDLQIKNHSLLGWLGKGSLKTVSTLIHPISSFKTALSGLTNIWDKSLIALSNGATRMHKVGTVFKTVFSALGKGLSAIGKTLAVVGKAIGSAGKTMGKAFVNQLKIIGKGVKGLGKGIWSTAKWAGREALSAGKFLGGKIAKGFKGSVKIAKFLGSKVLSGAKALTSKAISAGKIIGSKISEGIKASTKFSMGKRLATGALAGAAVAAPEAINAVKDRHSADKRSEDIGGAVGAMAGGTLTSMIPIVGPMLAPVGAIIGKYAGRWGGQAVNKFTKGWQSNKPPKKFWSLENLGWSTRDTFRKIGKWGSDLGKKFGQGIKGAKSFVHKNGKELALTAVNPLAGMTALLYKNNPKFRKWVNSLKKELGKFHPIKWIKSKFKGFRWPRLPKLKIHFPNIHPVRWLRKKFKGFKLPHLRLKNLRLKKPSLKGFNSFIGNLKKNTKNGFETAKKHASDGIKGILSNIGHLRKKGKSNLSAFTSWLGKNWNSLKKNSVAIWNKIKDTVKKNSNSARKNGSSNFSKLQKAMSDTGKDIKEGWHNLWNGIADFFENIWKSIKKKASDGINGIVGLLNGGIKGIDDVIHSFGGSSHAIKLIPKVKLATGTLGNLTPSITKPTLALLNDGQDSPETSNKETIWDTRTGALGVVNGTNVPFVLQPGMEVFSASQSRDLGFTRFAKGTNPLKGLENFVGGLGSWIGQKANQLKKWFDLATKIVSHPLQALNNLMKPSTKDLAGVFVDMGKGLFDKSKDAAKTWWSTLWSMASSNLNGDGGPATGLLKAVEKYGEGHKYVWGSAGPTTFDCSGLVMYALKHAYGIDFPHFSGSQYAMTQHISKDNAKMGDLVFWGSGGSEHVGVYAGGNNYFSAESPSQGIHMNTLDSVVGKGKPLFGRVRGLSQDNKKDSVKAKNGIERIIKSEVGNGFFRFMSKLGDLFGLNGPNASPTGDHSHWLKQAGIPASDYRYYDYIINHESNWNPKATNSSSGAYGIPQSLPGNKMASAGSDWRTNPITQLKWMKKYVNSAYGGVRNAYKFWLSHHAYGNGGIAEKPEIALIGEQGVERIINVNKDTADDLIDDTIQARAQVAPESPSGKLARLIDLDSVKFSAANGYGTPQSAKTRTIVTKVGNSAQSSVDGDVYIDVHTDSARLARVIYPKWKIMQGHDLDLAGAGGAIGE